MRITKHRVRKEAKPQYGTTEDEANTSTLSLCPPDQGHHQQWCEHRAEHAMVHHVRQELIVWWYVESVMHRPRPTAQEWSLPHSFPGLLGNILARPT